jgi:hypothetical protein
MQLLQCILPKDNNEKNSKSFEKGKPSLEADSHGRHIKHYCVSNPYNRSPYPQNFRIFHLILHQKCNFHYT